MEQQLQTYVSQWKETFPGVNPPSLEFESVEEIEEKLSACKCLIKNLEEKLSQEKFHLVFLQTCLAAKKKSHSEEHLGLSERADSSVESNRDFHDDFSNNDEESLDLVENIDEADDTLKPQTADSDMKPIPNKHVKMRQKKNEKSSSGNRKSNVLANVKMFESKVESTNLPSGSSSEDGLSSDHPTKLSVRNRSSYLQVWECNSGAEKEQRPAEESDTSEVNSKLDEAVLKMATKEKPQPPQRNVRRDYVEVWTCNTGDHVSVGVVGDQPNEQLAQGYGDDIENTQDYDVEDIDMKDGYGKKHYTLAGSDVKLRDGPPLSRGTWPAAGPTYQEGELAGNGAYPTDGSSIELSDLDNSHLSDSQPSENSREDSVDSPTDRFNPTCVSLDIRDTSPLRRFRRAQTTTERMSAVYSAYQWSDEDRATEGRSSLLSVQSIELQSSDDDHLSEGEEPPTMGPSTAPIKPSNPTKIFVFSRPKSTELDFHPDDSSLADNRKSMISVTDGHGPEVFPAAQKEAVSMVDYHKVRSIAEAEKLRMRQWVLSSVRDNEATYLEYLNTIVLYMKPLKATIATSQPVMSNQDFETLFHRVPELHQLHTEFYDNLKPRLDDWSADTTVGDLFKELVSNLNLYGDYLHNYKRAQHTVEKCAKENKQFAQLIESLKVQSRGAKDSASISLVEVLYKPVERVMRTTLVLQDLLKQTPHRHPDYQILRQALKQSQSFLVRINSSSSSFKPRRGPSPAAVAARSADRVLIKDGFLVEVASDGSRKLRHCFLFSDLLLCAKQKSTAGMFHSKASYECKWYIPLADLSFQPKEDSEAMPDVPTTSDDELRDMSNKAQQLKREIAREQKKNAAKSSSDGAPVKSRSEERMRKKLAELEARIVLAAPDLPLRIYYMQGKSYMFLMSSDYERIEWTEGILKQQESCFKSFSLTSVEINQLLSACFKHRKMNNIGSMLMNEDEELLSGYLNVTIHSGNGFLRACNPYCTLEVDSYGQFQTKAKTRACHDTKDPEWNEEFELELEGAMALRILCFDRAKEASAGASYSGDVLIAKGKVELIQESLRDKGEWIEEYVSMNEVTIKVSVKFTARERSLQRVLSKKSNGVFGVKIATVAKRDSSGIPGIVRKCVAEVERRGMSEVGIYRVSGVASEIQALKASFDTDRKDVNVLLGEVDINALAGVLKLYFRELPEPLFTDSRYNNFVEASSLTDPETKQRTITRLLSDLPPANYKTLHFLRNHLLKVASNVQVNKMNLHNLATVFGPTLLRPAEDKNEQGSQALMLNALRLDVHYQMDVLLYCLELHEMVDYDTLKNPPNNKENSDIPKPLSRSFDDLSSSPPHESEPTKPSTRPQTTEGITSKTKPEIPSPIIVTPPSSQPRYHPYEEIFIPPLNPKPKFGRPQVGRKPSTESNGRPNPKPKPAPRRTQPTKPQLPTVTDL